MNTVPISRHRLTGRRLAVMVMIGAAALLAVALICLCIGTTPIWPAELLRSLFTDEQTSTRTILLNLRLPRIALAVGVGGALAVCGALFQALLRNPLAEPYILGISNGCAVGAILGYLIGAGAFGTPLLAFAGGGVVTFTVLAISRGSYYGERSETMLLGGAMVAAIGASLIFLLLHFLGAQMRSAIQWMLGDLGTASARVGYMALGLFILLFLASLFSGNLLNALALGEQESASLGLNVRRAQTLAYLAGSLIVGIAVSFCGAIGFVGLVVPHILRRIIGADHRALLPMSLLGGAVFLVICDTVARSAMSALGSGGSELPVGAVTALIGAPVFITVLRRGRR